MRRAVVGRRFVRSVAEDVGFARISTGLFLGRMETILGFSKDSSWKCTLPAISSFENSFGVCVPAKIGAVKRGQSAWQLCLNEGNVRDADFVRESYTAAQNRVQRSRVSWCVHVATGCGGVRDRMRTNSFFSYGGNKRCAEEGERKKQAGGDVTMKTHVRDGI